MEYKIILADKTEILCTLNGNNHITKQDVSGVDFSNRNLKQITIDGVEHFNQICTNIFNEEDGTHIILRDLTTDEIRIAEQDEIINDLLAYVLGGM